MWKIDPANAPGEQGGASAGRSAGARAVRVGWSIGPAAAEDGPDKSEAHEPGDDVADAAEPAQLDAQSPETDTELRQSWKAAVRHLRPIRSFADFLAIKSTI